MKERKNTVDDSIVKRYFVNLFNSLNVDYEYYIEALEKYGYNYRIIHNLLINNQVIKFVEHPTWSTKSISYSEDKLKFTPVESSTNYEIVVFEGKDTDIFNFNNKVFSDKVINIFTDNKDFIYKSTNSDWVVKYKYDSIYNYLKSKI